MEVSELHKSKRQLIELLERKDSEISERNATIKGYLDKILLLLYTMKHGHNNLVDVWMSGEDPVQVPWGAAGCAPDIMLWNMPKCLNSDLFSTLSAFFSSSSEIEVGSGPFEIDRVAIVVLWSSFVNVDILLKTSRVELFDKIASFILLKEKELIERHNVWLNDELTAKVNSLMELRKKNGEVEADMSAKLVDAEKKLNESSSSLKWKDDRVRELESKLSSLQEVTKLVELYKESSEEWSKKAGELEGVIKALETHSNQVENEYKERLEKEVAARQEFEKEAVSLKEKLEKCEGELESIRNANEVNLLPFSFSTAKPWTESIEENEMAEANHSLVPSIPVGVSGTALAASLLRDGWSLAKMYVKYQEAVDAMRHEQLGRKQSQAILERVLYEIEEKAGVILDERAEHERLVEAYSVVNQKLQHSLHEEASLERTIQELKADLRRHERDYSLAQKEIVDLQREITVLLKECRDIQLRCGSTRYDLTSDNMTAPFVQLNAMPDADDVISESLLTFKDINGLVEQNVQLRSLVRSLSDQIENKEVELKEKFEKVLQKHSDEAASKVDAVLTRAEEQGQMIESLHTSVAMYKRLYEEEHKHQASYAFPQDTSSGSPLAFALCNFFGRNRRKAFEMGGGSPWELMIVRLVLLSVAFLSIRKFDYLVVTEGRNGVMLLLEDSQETGRKAQEQASARLKSLEEDLERLRNEIISLRSQRDKLALEASFAQEKLDRFMRDFDHQRDETNGVIARNVEFSQLIIDYQRKLREGSESVQAAEELSRKLTMEVSILKHEKQMLLNSEKRACDEVRSLSERVYRLQEARATESRKQEDYIKKIEREWAEAKSELLRERDNVRNLTLERESSMKSAMRQVEEMGKELANGLHAVAGAEARAALAEARCSDLEKKIKSSETKGYQKDSASGPSPSSANEAVANLHTAKEEIEKLREEAQVNKDHMLQYKGIALVNEAALKQMEVAYENFKLEADKVKEKLEAELLSLRERVNELEKECILKTKEAASAAAGKEEALASALSTIASLKEESSVKMSEIMVLETKISTMKSDLEKEHQRWRTAQANYERQVILQSDTIQELTKTSQALASLQDDASDLRKLADTLKTENEDLKSKLETEISVLEKSKIEAERKYNEIDEQNKILHSRLEALHIKLAEKYRDSGTKLTDSIDQDKLDDAGLQNVVSYLRRSKEIGETEISLLKQEKLRLQSQLESALKAAEMAQASLQAERANSRAFLFTEEEFKSLQLQVREMNLLRESNIQLREENKHNFDECQKLHEVAQKARIRTENLETLLGEREAEVDACKREIEMQKIEREHLRKRVDELLERCKNIDVEDYNRMTAEVQQLQVNARERDAQLDELKKLVSEKEDVISQLEQDLARCRVELKERETRINSLLQVEKRSENLLKEKEEQSKEIQALSKQLEDSRQAKRVVTDAAGEADMREKEMEKDTRIQMLEKTVEKVRDDLRKQKDDHKAKRKIVENSYQSTVQVFLYL
ncbi:hypothetical protein RJ640_016714 [Escallonia rubra]|uniref:Nuclear-pore anchor n=1 Tax=Escallonia rubra TaxID=112253 RepID=A0AA88QW66_9ASTE|nr:hypothetical protein RJ640_016714 [Escallonia rubra]